MGTLTNQAQTLLTGLSDFWQRLFADKDVLNALYAATEVELGQAYLDIVTQVLNQNLDDVPLFNREYWYLLTVREDQVRYDGTHYTLPLPDGLREAEFLLNRIYNPTSALELDIDFTIDIDNELLLFTQEPFTSYTGIATRALDIEPTVYRTGTDGLAWDGTPIPPPQTDLDYFQILGITAEGSQGTLPDANTLQVTRDVFTLADIGRTVVHTDPADPALTVTRTVIGLAGPRLVQLSPPVTGAGTYNWDIRDTTYFTSYDVGTQIVITDPTSLGRDLTYTIDTVVDGLTVTLTEDLPFTPSATLRYEWAHQSQTRVSELSFWVPDGFFERENLYLSFGYLLNRYEPSTESYRALIQGIFRYFMLGPALTRTESALNVISGVPVVRTDGEVYESLDTSNAGYDLVVTDVDSYEIPKGSLKATLTIGDTLEAFAPLTALFTVEDYIRNPTWYFGETIPTDILPGPNSPRRAVDPNLHENVIGSNKWLIGDPDFYIGADDHRFAVDPEMRCDLLPSGGSTTKLEPVLSKLHDEDIGKTLTIETVDYTITAVGADPLPYVETGVDYVTILAGLSYACTVTVTSSDVINVTGHTFDVKRDVGRAVRVTASTTVPLGDYIIYDVISPTSMRVTDIDGNPQSFAVDPALTVQFALCWELEVRPPYRHTSGYLFMRDFLKNHIFNVSYSYTQFPDVPYPRPQLDLQEVLLDGKSAYTYLIVDAGAAFSDEVQVNGDLQVYGSSGMSTTDDVFVHEEPLLTIGGGWNIGDYYYYSNPETAWFDVVREHEFGVVTEILGASTMETVNFAGVFTGGTDPTVDVDLYAWNGVAWQPTGTSFTLDSAGTNFFSETVSGRRLAIDCTATGGPDQVGVNYGYIASQPDCIRGTEPAVTSITGSVAAATDEFTDANFSFNTSDILREIIAKVAGIYTRYRISSIISDTTVALVDVVAGTAPSFTVETDIEWTLGPPRQTATSVSIGGSNPIVVKTVPGNYIVSWPVLVTLEN
jgi:hypothetical protein